MMQPRAKEHSSAPVRFRPSTCPCGRKWSDCPWWGAGGSEGWRHAFAQRKLYGCDDDDEPNADDYADRVEWVSRLY